MSFDLLMKSGSLKGGQNRIEFFPYSIRLLVVCPYAFLNFTCFKACECTSVLLLIPFHLMKVLLRIRKTLHLSNSPQAMSSCAVVKGVIYVQETQLFFASNLYSFNLPCAYFTHGGQNTRHGVVNSYCNSIFQWLLLIVKILCKISKMCR